MVNERGRLAGSVYSEPRVVSRIDDCFFYHSMDLPQHGLVAGEWDLRRGIERYLGHVDFRGKRVLDIGTASGFLAFWMERQGAEVIGFDLSDKYGSSLLNNYLLLLLTIFIEPQSQITSPVAVKISIFGLQY
jgi:hypothetical protein